MTDRFRIATFNVENFGGPGKPLHKRESYDAARFADKARWIAGIIDEYRLDVVGFQEIFTRDALEEVYHHSTYWQGFGPLVDPTQAPVSPGVALYCPATATDPATGLPRNAVVDAADGTIAHSGPNLALVSRFPVIGSGEISAFPPDLALTLPTRPGDDDTDPMIFPRNRFERPPLQVRLALPGGVAATVIVVHLKSKGARLFRAEKDAQPGGRTDFRLEALGAFRSLVMRAAEATGLRAHILKLIDDQPNTAAGEPLMVLGDFNDDMASVTTNIIAGPEPDWDARDGKRNAFLDVRLRSVHEMQALRSLRPIEPTSIHRTLPATIDDILASREFADDFATPVAHVLGVRVLNDHLTESRLAEPEEEALDPVTGRPLPPLRCDHGIVIAEFRMGRRGG